MSNRAHPATGIATTLLTPASETWGRIEYAITVPTAPGLNPFRARELAIDGELTLPSGSRLVVPAFWHQEYVLLAGGRARAVGAPGWRLRLCGAEAGSYQLQIVLRERGRETARSHVSGFTLRAGSRPGHIRVHPGSRYFAHADGRPYFPVGENLAFPTAVAKAIACVHSPQPRPVPMRSPDLSWDEGYARWITRLGAAGGNWIRVWMDSTFYLEDGEPGSHSLEHGWRLDHLLGLCEQHGIAICLTLDSFRTLCDEWGKDHWNGGEKTAYGRHLAAIGATGTETFFTDSEVAQMQHDRYRALVGRLGHSSAIFCWELFNEFETVVGDAQQKLEWSARATADLRQVDAYGHLVKSSAHWQTTREYWQDAHGACDDLHPYVGWHTGTGAKDLAQFLWDYSRVIDHGSRPWLLGEAGLAREVVTPLGLVGDFADRDVTGVNLHETLWSGIFTGSAGSGMVWWWDEQVDLPNLYGRFTGIARFAAAIPWGAEDFRVAEAIPSRHDVRTRALRGSSQWLLWLQSRYWTSWEVVHGGPQPTFSGVTITIPAITAGTWSIHWWSTERGEVVERATATAGPAGLVVCAPPVTTDWVARLMPG